MSSHPNGEPEWATVAAVYRYYDPPFLPTQEDLRYMESAFSRVAERFTKTGEPSWRGLILGVTPSLANLAWPVGTRVEAYDNSAAMVGRVWPGDGATPWGWREAVVDSWETLSDRPDAFHFACGDGSFNSFNSTAPPGVLFEILGATLKTGGICALRVYLRSPENPSPEQVIEEFISGRWTNPSIFRFLMCGALQHSFDEGMVVGDFYDYCERRLRRDPRFREAADRHADKWGVVTAARDSRVRLYFPDLDLIRRLAEPHLRIEDVHYSAHETGFLSPVVVFTKESAD